MKPFGWKTLTGVLLVMLLAAPVWALKAVAPGMVNYTEGQAMLENQPLDKDSIGRVDLHPGQVLNTGSEGKTEVLLGPGQIFRLGDNSSAQMIAEHPPQVELTKGQATIQVLPNRTGPVLVQVAGATARLEKAGLYFFDADSARILAYQGEAEVQAGNRTVAVKSGHELDLNQNGKLKTAKFDKKDFERNELVQFSGLRSEYLAEANTDAANTYYMSGTGWYGPGWYWDPAFYTYTWVPGGDVFCDPFGWCFFSPGFVVNSPFLFTGFFVDCGVRCFGHFHRGRERLPSSFTSLIRPNATGIRTNRTGTSTPTPPAMAGNTGVLGGTTAGTRGTTASPTVMNHSGFNRGTGAIGGFGGGTGGRISGAHAGGGHATTGGGSMSGAHAGGGFGGGAHR